MYTFFLFTKTKQNNNTLLFETSTQANAGSIDLFPRK